MLTSYPIRTAVLMLAGVLLWAPAAPAVIVGTGTGTQNTTAPFPDPGWDNVGSLNGASGVYLGNGYVITAAHVGAGNITFGGLGTFNPVPASTIQLTNPDTSNADLVLFKLTTNPSLPSLSIGPTPDDGDPLIMIGNGRDRATSLTMWDINAGVWTETANPAIADASGYKWLGTSTKRWGTNVARDIDGNPTIVISQGGNNTTSIITSFSSAGTSSEAQAAAGDSGGAVFAGGQLVGIMHTIGTYSGQPGNTAVFGNETYAADLASYADQINAIVPEPASMAVMLMGGLLMLRRPRGR